MKEIVLWTVIAGVPFTLIAVTGIAALIDHNRVRSRRRHLRSRLVR